MLTKVESIGSYTAKVTRLYSTIQLRGNKIFVTLWEGFAKQMLEYVSANP
ncbi:hypothetical protein LXL04_011702 [Taraxacum kok-saghyz]